MEQVVLLNDRREILVERSLKHAARFSWNETARQTLAVYRNVLQR